MFSELHQIKFLPPDATHVDKRVKSADTIVLNLNKLVAVEHGNPLKKEELEQFMYVSDKIGNETTILKFDNFEVEVAESYLSIRDSLKRIL